jgi:hypothetical protein
MSETNEKTLALAAAGKLNKTTAKISLEYKRPLITDFMALLRRFPELSEQDMWGSDEISLFLAINQSDGRYMALLSQK